MFFIRYLPEHRVIVQIYMLFKEQAVRVVEHKTN